MIKAINKCLLSSNINVNWILHNMNIRKLFQTSHCFGLYFYRSFSVQVECSLSFNHTLQSLFLRLSDSLIDCIISSMSESVKHIPSYCGFVIVDIVISYSLTNALLHHFFQLPHLYWLSLSLGSGLICNKQYLQSGVILYVNILRST